ncbi:MAG: helix-turn-helix domain-containing protein [Verrucomicrobiota bacterium]|nr:helix-turn-helix domain-containing protein [Verrucomicrobiota bacterium]
MSQFSNQLQTSMEEAGFKQTDLVDKIDVSQGQMSRYVNGVDRPGPDVFEQLCALFPEKQRAQLIVAYLLDDVPAQFRNLISVEPAKAALRTAEDAPAYRSRMPLKLRQAYDYLGSAALDKPRVATTIINTYELVKSGA